MKLEATIPYVAPMNTSATRRHWSHAHRERIKWQVWVSYCLSKRPAMPWKRARVTVTRISSAPRHPDIDNLHYSCKPLFDALVAVGILADDGPEVERVVRWERGPRRKPQTRIVIEPLE